VQNNHCEAVLRILHLEDNAADRELIAHRLMGGPTPCEFLSATNEVEYRRALSDPHLDLILSDFSLPGFSGMAALSIAKEIRPGVPFLFVSGTIGEDCAAETLKAGARDYVLKDRLERLPSAIRRAVEDAKQRAERLRTVAALRESEERFRQVTESIEEVFWLAELNPGRRIIYVSPAYAQIWGQPCEQLYHVPNSWLASIHPSDRARVEAAVEQQSLGHYDVEYRIVRPDGTVRWINDRAFPIRNERGAVYRVAGLAKDVTSRRQLEEEVRQSQKMDAIGQFAGGIAHDFNNVLAVIQMQTSLLLTEPEIAPKLSNGLQMIMGAAERAANLTRQLLTFSHREVKRAKDIDPAKVLGDTVKLLHRIVGENINFETRFAPGLAAVHADAAMLEQVLMNLVINARDAMPDGGRLVVSLDHDDAAVSRVARHPGVRPGRFVRLCVADSGCGIPRENLPRIFEPFFTTKEPGRGTGLGLATVFRIASQHHGWVEVDSEINVGTTFRVFLPASDRSAVETAPPAITPQRGRDESILLLEDDPAVRSLARTVLEFFGYQVFEAATASAALQLWNHRGGNFDLLITDLILPLGMSGSELAQELTAAKPRLKVIYTSGYSSEVVARYISPDERRVLLEKPYSAQQLAAIVRLHLDRSPDRLS
jgi:two-component system cell cycle sensor histidine kinase/response regulator CckA